MPGWTKVTKLLRAQLGKSGHFHDLAKQKCKLDVMLDDGGQITLAVKHIDMQIKLGGSGQVHVCRIIIR